MNLVTLDFETYFGKGYSLSETKVTTESYIRDERFKAHGCGVKVNDGPSRWVTGDKLPQLFANMPWDKIAMVGHNLQFDGSILAWRYGYVPKLFIDTLGMSRALVGQHSARHGLDALGQLLLGAGKLEGLRLTYGVRDLEAWLEAKLAAYCLDDCDKTYRLLKLFAPHFPKKEYQIMDWNLRKFIQPQLWMDTELLAQYLIEVQEGKENALLRAGLVDELGRPDRTVLMSNPKYAEALKAYGVVPPVKINPKGEIKFAFAKTDHEHKALLEHDNPDVQALVAARIEVKTTIEETRTQMYLAASYRGRWPVAYSYCGAINTQRPSGNKGGGGNPMNLKRGGTLRDAIYADEGMVQLVFDLSQIECRITLWLGMLSKQSTGMEREALDLMAGGGDLYSYFASMMFGREIIKKNDPNERQIGKSAVLGLGFGMGPGRFMDYSITMGAKGVDAQLAESTVHLYRNTYKGVRAMWRTLEQGMKNALQQVSQLELGERKELDLWTFGPIKIVREPLFGHLGFQTEGGLIVKYPDIEWDAEGEGTYRDGNHRVKIFGGKFMENIVQHMARNILYDKLLDMHKHYNVVMSTYDEIVALVQEVEVERAIMIGKQVMNADHPMFPGLPIGSEYGYHNRYGRAKN